MLDYTEWVMKKDNLEKLAALETQETVQINCREYGMGNQNKNQEKLAT